MTVEIWSDIMCPFCYIGKKRFEKAVNALGLNNDVEVIYRSFLLDPDLVTDSTKHVIEHLAQKKGVSVEEAQKMNDYVTQMAADEGLSYKMDDAVVANSRNAHRLLHFAKSKGKQVALKELLLRSYFEEGKNIDDLHTLKTIGGEIDLDQQEIEQVYSSAMFTEDVINDIQRAQQIGIQGVPFFVINGKYALSGAQSTQTFRKALNKVQSEESS